MTSNHDYVQVMRRTNTASAVGAVTIQILTLIAVADRPRVFAWVLAGALALVPFNTLVTAVLLPRYGTAAEVLRATTNVIAGLLVGHVAGWPVAHWMWLPFIAVTFDDFKNRTIWTVIGFACATYALLAVSDGIDWRIPLSFSVAAASFRLIIAARARTIREMLLESQKSRAELDRAHAELRTAHDRLGAEADARLEAERELRQAQKLEAVGRLAAGIAHEINTPLQSVMNSLQFVEEAAPTLLAARDAGGSAVADDERAFFMREVPDALAMASDGVGRVAKIVATLNELSHPELRVETLVDVNSAVEAGLLVATHEYRYVADVETILEPVPPVLGRAGELTQVVIALVMNAAHAVADVAARSGRRGLIRVYTVARGDDVLIGVEDSGDGIPASIRHRVFEPFFTTRDVGSGSGQGLAIARAVVERHRGDIEFDSQSGVGTTFIVRLPRSKEQRSAA